MEGLSAGGRVLRLRWECKAIGRICRVGAVLGLRRVRGCCNGRKGVAGTVGSVDFSIRTKRFLKVVNTSNSKGAALLGYVSAVSAMDTKRVFLSKASVARVGPGSLTHFHERGLKFVFRSFGLLSALAVSRGVTLTLTVGGIPTKDMRSHVLSVTKGLGVDSVLGGCPCRMSNKRGRHYTYTETVVGGPGLLLTSRPAKTLSDRSSRVLLSAVRDVGRRLETAVLVMARSTFATDCTGHVLFLGSKRVFVRLHGNGSDEDTFFSGVLGILAVVKKKRDRMYWAYFRGYGAIYGELSNLRYRGSGLYCLILYILICFR